MNLRIVILMAGLALTGCATSSTVQSRVEERNAAFTAMPADVRASVAAGQLKAGMNPDAVYIAWGAPSQVTKGGNEAGETETWFYFGGYVQQTRYWGSRRMYYDYYPATYVRAQVMFADGLVKQWQQFGEPPY
jgi:outer membrane protein assembly factor BamE (lipoprotein component of BamABCDE complex)